MPKTLPDHFFLHYLLLPILALVVLVALVAINQKKGLLSGRQVVVMVLVFALPMALAGLFGLIYLWFIPWYYVLMQAIFFGIGVLYLRQLDKVLGEDRRTELPFTYLLTSLILLLGGYCFSLIFNLFSSLPYGLWAATCVLPFVVPLLFFQTFEALVAIPNEIRKVWHYPRPAPEVVLDDIDHFHLMILEVELRKRPGITEAPVKVKARAAQELPFGVWFQKFIDDYNYKFPHDPILTTTADATEYGWLFYYVRASPFRLRRYIDADLSIAHNYLNERCLIVAKRVEES
ncbi:TssN family type VI secretion system protein [Hymenobacter crusticola]|uniref:TssN family type VI secretion system protein n=1 Tax=Hymenobacter crusticola TaxID=1770526 RepID=A0A243WGA0_9BACT|nr:TssN family type VI secretion system protein [Hymenobacter crusticola]OUJ74796.1 hypothetical protein BXP70_08555 [Hymenobacter crusticola]